MRLVQYDPPGCDTRGTFRLCACHGRCHSGILMIQGVAAQASSKSMAQVPEGCYVFMSVALITAVCCVVATFLCGEGGIGSLFFGLFHHFFPMAIGRQHVRRIPAFCGIFKSSTFRPEIGCTPHNKSRKWAPGEILFLTRRGCYEGETENKGRRAAMAMALSLKQKWIMVDTKEKKETNL